MFLASRMIDNSFLHVVYKRTLLNRVESLECTCTSNDIKSCYSRNSSLESTDRFTIYSAFHLPTLFVINSNKLASKGIDTRDYRRKVNSKTKVNR